MYLPSHFLRVSAITLELYSYCQWSSETSLIIESLVLCNCSGAGRSVEVSEPQPPLCSPGPYLQTASEASLEFKW